MLRSLISLLTSGCLFVVTATPPSIGIVKSNGEFRVDGSPVRGNGTVFEGNLIETTSARSVVQLHGVQITLLPDSRAKVYRNRTVFAKGSGLIKEVKLHVIEVAALRITPATTGGVVQVEVAGPDRIAVAARSGAAEVRTASGVLLASLRPGMALAFDPQGAAASLALKMTGVLELRDGKYLLTDATSNITVELRGPDLAKFVGKRIEIKGSTIPGATPAEGASQVVRVGARTVKVLGATGTAGAAGAGSASGLSAAATGAIIGGVAIAGTVVGLAAAGTFSSERPTSPK